MPPSQPQADQSAGVVEGGGDTALTSGDDSVRLSVAIVVPCVAGLLLCGIAGCIYMQRRNRHHTQLQKRASALSKEIGEVFHSGMHEPSNGGTLSLRQDSIPVQYMNASGKQRSPILTSPVITSGTSTSCTTSGTTPAASIIRRAPSWPAQKSEQLEFMTQFNSTPAHNGAVPCGLVLLNTTSSSATHDTPAIQYGAHQKKVLSSLKENKILRSASMNQRALVEPMGAGPRPQVLPPLRLCHDLATPSTSTALEAQASEAVIAPTGTPPLSPFAMSLEINLADIGLLDDLSPETSRTPGLELPPESPTTENAGALQLATSAAYPSASRLQAAPAPEYVNNYSLSSELQLGDLKDDDDDQANAGTADTKKSASRNIKRMAKVDGDEDFRI